MSAADDPNGTTTPPGERQPSTGASPSETATSWRALSALEQRVWIALLVTILVVQALAIQRQSATGDGTLHLIAGHQAMRWGENLVNWEHPPLVKLIQALPVSLGSTPLLERKILPEESLGAIRAVHADSEHLLWAVRAGRWMLVITLVVPLLGCCFLLGRYFGGVRGGLVLTSFVGLGFSVVANLPILQTDTAAALAYVAVVLLGSALARGEQAWRWSVLLGLAWGVGLASKYSAVLLAPSVLVAVLLAPRTWLVRLGLLSAACGTALVIVAGSYGLANRHYDPETGQQALAQYVEGRATLVVGESFLPMRETFERLEQMSPSVTQWLVGFWGIRIQNRDGIYPSFAFGSMRSAGWWWYFPVLFLVKIPIAILVVGLWRCADCVRVVTSWSRPDLVVLGTTVLIYLGFAVASSYNIGYRHLLPVLPLLLLPLAVVVGRLPRIALVLPIVLALETALLTPRWMSATNTWWLGGANPTRFAFSAGNLEYSQNYLALARALERRGIEQVGVLHPGVGEEIVDAYLDGARMLVPGQDPGSGWMLVNVIVEQYVPAILAATPQELSNYDARRSQALALEEIWNRIRQGEDHGYVASTYRLYRLP